MKERVLAVAGAICLVAIALVVRTALAGDDGPTSSGSDPAVIACTSDLQAICDALAEEADVTVASEALDLDLAATPDPSVDAWITWSPAPGIADIDADTTIWQGVAPLGDAPLALLADARSAGDLSARCPGGTDWVCTSSVVDDTLSIGVGRATTAEGLARLTPLALGLSPDANPDDLASSDLRRILESPPGGQDDVRSMATDLATAPGRVGLVVGPDALLEAQADTAQGQARSLRVLDLAPEARATVVIATRSAADAARLAEACDGEAVRAALESLGLTPCAGTIDEPDLAGFLWRVRDEVS